MSGGGPKANGSYCRENLYAAMPLEVVDGDIVSCGLAGLINQHVLPYSELVTTIEPGTTPKTGTFGDGDGVAEYRVSYTVTPTP